MWNYRRPPNSTVWYLPADRLGNLRSTPYRQIGSINFVIKQLLYRASEHFGRHELHKRYIGAHTRLVWKYGISLQKIFPMERGLEAVFTRLCISNELYVRWNVICCNFKSCQTKNSCGIIGLKGDGRPVIYILTILCKSGGSISLPLCQLAGTDKSSRTRGLHDTVAYDLEDIRWISMGGVLASSGWLQRILHFQKGLSQLATETFKAEVMSAFEKFYSIQTCIRQSTKYNGSAGTYSS